MDLFSLIRTIAVVVTSDGIVEGGTGALEEKKKKILIITNHSYMLYQFRKELIEQLMKEYDVVLSMPFVGHEDDFAAMGCKCVETDVDRRGINPVTDFKLLQFYNKIISDEKPDKVITYSIKAEHICRTRMQTQENTLLCKCAGLRNCISKKTVGKVCRNPCIKQHFER